MSNTILALEITALGMGLVFAAIILLWWVMALLTWITADREKAISNQPNPQAVNPPLVVDYDCTIKAKVAAVTVAIALAEQKTCAVHPLCDPPASIVSAWQLGTRTRQLYEKGTSMVRKPRKIG
jgi:Na+-transporting methylmalonyl-CoA/oxaloacetate decarboxylase gamma subunit